MFHELYEAPPALNIHCSVSPRKEVRKWTLQPWPRATSLWSEDEDEEEFPGGNVLDTEAISPGRKPLPRKFALQQVPNQAGKAKGGR